MGTEANCAHNYCRALVTITLFVVLGLVITWSATYADAVIYVNKNAPGPTHDGQSWETTFLTVQEGVNAAMAGMEVWVAKGVYMSGLH